MHFFVKKFQVSISFTTHLRNGFLKFSTKFAISLCSCQSNCELGTTCELHWEVKKFIASELHATRNFLTHCEYVD